MNNLYEKTTESLESLQNTSCGTKFKTCNTKQSSKKTKSPSRVVPSLEVEMEKYEHEEEERDDFDQPSIGIVSGGSEASSIFGSNADITINQPNRPRISRARSIRQSIAKGAKGTLDFFGVAEQSEEEAQRQKWNQRRIRHLSRRIGRMKESVSAPTTPDTPDGLRFPTIVEYAMQRSYIGQHKARRENAAKLLWRTASRRLSAKPQYDVSTIQSFGGRSFAPADLMDDDISVFDSASNLDERKSITPTPTPLLTPSFIDDRSFFHFDTYHPSTIEEEDSLDMTDGGRPPSPTMQEISAPSTPSPRIVTPWDKSLGPEPTIQSVSPYAKRRKPEYIRQPSDRRSRMQVKPVKKEKKKKKILKREFGKGLVGNLLNRTFNRNRINSKVQEQMEDISDHRPYFTYWLSFVQVTILIVMISVYSFAPIGVSQKKTEQNVLLSRNGILQHENVKKVIVESFWIGPRLNTLILLGAKYAPCMRHDKLLYKQLFQENLAENKTGCCMQTLNTGCIQRQQSECSTSFTKFKPKTVCGQDPDMCLNPASKAPNEWDKNSIINWPVCRKTVNLTGINKENYPHMTCEITGRPCCIGTQAQCIITSQAYCEFLDGVYHSDRTLCSQVDCLSSTCGLLPFANENQPDQFYRLWLSLFLNAGILHVVLILIFNFTILRDIEKMAGWLRTGLIFILSGICGNLWSSILIPYEPEVGPSGSSFGIIACLFVEVIQSWQLIRNPFVAIGKLCGVVLVLFLLGLLPYIDNFAHIFGFIHGFFLAFIFLPYVTFGKWDRRRKQIQIVIAAVVLIIITIIGFILFYVYQDINTSGVTYFNCVPITTDFCKNFHQGKVLERRETIY
ncbi:inactive rhomboid protein 1-like [Hydractinia symbiolongicarpus]|uniref:inactive rhomboid protein 1-like n=1 Tax=Hydractinia symbiolongicarpus TaxID=13093 RepID=UPI00254AE742|nr:inactive rhomboid protein 1-like [Hydractinia symbiolongicarpus]